MHAILHDASGFVFEYSKKMAGLFLCLTLSSDKRVFWSRDRTCLLSVCKNLQKQFFQFAGMLKSRPVLDFDGFRHKKSGFTIKELAVLTEIYCDTVSFLSPNSINILSLSERQSFNCVSKYLHGLKWDRGDHPYCYLQQKFDSIALRFPLATFKVKGTEKT